VLAANLRQALFVVKRKPPAMLVVPKSFSFAQSRRSGRLPCAKGAVTEGD